MLQPDPKDSRPSSSRGSVIDVLMVTHARPAYTRLSLPRLLDSCDDAMRIWVWHNGNDPETLDIVRSLLPHPALHRLHHSPENQLLRAPINWFLSNADGDLLSLINDDCLVNDGWGRMLRQAHEDVDAFGVLACWHFSTEDYLPELAERKTRTFTCGHRIMLNPWVQGSGIVMKRRCAETVGLLGPNERGFTSYCIRVAAAGWINGWYMPILPIDHMDDPRSPHTLLKTDADIARHLPLSAQFRGIDSIEGWISHLRRSARIVQESPIDPRQYIGLRKRVRRLWTRVRRRELMY